VEEGGTPTGAPALVLGAIRAHLRVHPGEAPQVIALLQDAASLGGLGDLLVRLLTLAVPPRPPQKKAR